MPERSKRETPPPERREEIPPPRTLTLPPDHYQPRKAVAEAEYDMPGASPETVRRAFFRPFNVRREA